MKTQNLIKRTAVFLLLAFALVPLTWSSFANDTCLLVIDKNFNVRICENLLAYSDMPKIEEIYINPSANLYFIEFKQEEDELEIEDWMKNEYFKKSFDLNTYQFEWEIAEEEEELEIEEWMVAPNLFTEEEEPELEIEDWMFETWSK